MYLVEDAEKLRNDAVVDEHLDLVLLAGAHVREAPAHFLHDRRGVGLQQAIEHWHDAVFEQILQDNDVRNRLHARTSVCGSVPVMMLPMARKLGSCAAVDETSGQRRGAPGRTCWSALPAP